MIEEVKEFASDLKKGLGDKGFYVLIVAALGFGLYNLLKSDGGDKYVAATGYADYPSVGENSEVVIDSINNEIWAHNDEILGAITTAEDEINQNVDEHFEETNGYIEEGLNSTQQTVNYINNGYSYSQGYYGTSSGYGVSTDPTLRKDSSVVGHTVSADGKKTGVETTNGFEKVPNGLYYGVPEYESSGSTFIMNTSGTKKTGTQGSANKTNPNASKSTSSTSKPKTTSSTSSTSKPKTTSSTSSTSKPKTTSSTYTYKNKSGLNTSTSIVDALKATGADSSMSNRQKIAAANGISNYTGTATQNITMLNKMKAGTLKKP